MLKKGVFILVLFWSFISQAQFNYEIKEGPLVKVSGFDLLHGFMGGLNSPQFSEFDLNRDGVNDLVVFDRADFKLYTFLRSQKNQFVYAPEYESQLPAGETIYVLRDMNSDGLLDVFTTSEAGDLLIYKNTTSESDDLLQFEGLGPWYYRNQYDDNYPILYNPLSFANASTDMPGIVDIDGDGDIDIVNYDQFNLTYMMYKDVRAEKKWDKDTFEFQNMDYCFGYFWEGFDSEIRLNTCPFDLSFPLKLKPRHVGGAGCWFFDEDGDGDMEMYISNLDFKRITRLVNGKSDNNHDYDTMILVDTMFLDGKSFDSYVFPVGYMIDVDNDGLKDMVIAPNAAFETKEKNQIRYYRNAGSKNKADFKFDRSNFIIEQMLDLGGNSSPAFIDIDNDGDKDLLVMNNGDYYESLGIKDRIALFENTGDAEEPIFELKDSDFLGLTDSSLIGASLSVGDIDNNGKEDILIGTINGSLYWFANEGNSWKFKTNQLLNYEKQSGESSWSPAVIDYNKDGINDLLVGFYNGNVALFEGLNKTGLPNFKWISSNAWGMKANDWLQNSSEPKFSSYGYASPSVGDIDNDGTLEIIIGGYNDVLRVYHVDGHNPEDSLLADENIVFKSFGGDTVSTRVGGRLQPCLANITGDSIPELVIGNLRGGLNFASHILSSETSIDNSNISIVTNRLMPNPVALGSRFQITSPNKLEKWDVEIYDINGKVVFANAINRGERGLSISSHEIGSGVFFINTYNLTSNRLITDKVIVLE